jgi:filamentous hemagglutinin family protein
LFLYLIFFLFFLPAYVLAAIIVDDNAPKELRPTLRLSTSGLLQIDIVKPNAEGLSHNRYQLFDTELSGNLLNNGATLSESQLAGWIAKNPNLAETGPAKVILNEVQSDYPSILKGFLELTGQPADVFVVNKQGVICDGCGFVGIPRMALRTSLPKEMGLLSSHSSSPAKIVVQGEGLNALGSHLELGAENILLDAPLWADTICLSLEGLNERSLLDEEPSEFWISVAPKARLQASVIDVNTHAVVGASFINEGLLLSHGGRIHVNSAGIVRNNGAMKADDIVIHAERIVNQAKVDHADHCVNDNTGLMVAAHALLLTADRIYNDRLALMYSRVFTGIKADYLENRGGWLQSDGNADFRVERLDNINNRFESALKTVDEPRVFHWIQPENSLQRYNEASLSRENRSGTYVYFSGSTEIGNWTEYVGVHTQQETQVLHSQPARIAIAGLLTGEGHWLNDKSLWTYQEAVMERGSLTAKGAWGERRDRYGGQTWTAKIKHHSFFSVHSDHYTRRWSMKSPYQPSDRIDPFSMNVLTTEELQKRSRVVSALSRYKGVDPSHHPLFESDPLLRDRVRWGMRFMLDALGVDPLSVAPLLYDPFLEQNYISQQRRGGNEDEYKKMMDYGVAMAGQWGWEVGQSVPVEEQMFLKEDMLWPVEEWHILPDGQKVKVLVPRLYSHHLLSAQPQMTGRHGLFRVDYLDNQGFLTAVDHLRVEAGRVYNTGELSAKNLVIHSQEDVILEGGRISANGRLQVDVGRDLLFLKGTLENHSLDTSVLSARRHIDFQGLREDAFESIISKDKRIERYSQAFLGSRLRTAGDLLLKAGGNIQSTGTEWRVGQHFSMMAGGDIQLSGTRASLREHLQGYERDRSLLGSSKQITAKEHRFEEAILERIAAHSLFMEADHHLRLQGVEINTLRDLTIKAQEGIHISGLLLEESVSQQHYTRARGFRIQEGVPGYGHSNIYYTRRAEQTLYQNSFFSSQKGDLLFHAQGGYQAIGGVFTAPEGVLHIEAPFIQLLSAKETIIRDEHLSRRVRHIDGRIEPTLLEALKQGLRLRQQMKDSTHKVLQGEALLGTGLSLERLWRNKNTGGVLTMGRQSQQLDEKEHRETTQATQLFGKKIALLAKGAGASLRTEGATIKALTEGLVYSNGIIHLDSSREENYLNKQNRLARSTMAMGMHMDGILRFQINEDKSYHRERSEELLYHPTRIESLGSFRVRTAGDVIMKGTELCGESLAVDVGGDLWMEHLANHHQKRVESQHRQLSAILPLGQGIGRLSLDNSALDAHLSSDASSIPVGFFAGEGGLDLRVKGERFLTGNRGERAEQTFKRDGMSMSVGPRLITSPLYESFKLVGRCLAAGRKESHKKGGQDFAEKTAQWSLQQDIEKPLFQECFHSMDEAYAKIVEEGPRYFSLSAEPMALREENRKGVHAKPLSMDAVVEAIQETRNPVLYSNGLMNNLAEASVLAIQNTGKEEAFLSHTNFSGSALGELMVAAYEKYLSPSYPSKSQKDTVELLQRLGNTQKLHWVGHSRGTIIQQNVLQALSNSSYRNPLLEVSALGAAVSQDRYEAVAGVVIQNHSPSGNIHFFYHPNDPVSVFIGGNSGDVIGAIKNIPALLLSDHSAHSCYGLGRRGCAAVQSPQPLGPWSLSYEPKG